MLTIDDDVDADAVGVEYPDAVGWDADAVVDAVDEPDVDMSLQATSVTAVAKSAV